MARRRDQSGDGFDYPGGVGQDDDYEEEGGGLSRLNPFGRKPREDSSQDSGGGLMGNLRSRLPFGGGEEESQPQGGGRSPLPGGSRGSSPSRYDDEDDSGGGLMGNLRSRLPFGSKDDQPGGGTPGRPGSSSRPGGLPGSRPGSSSRPGGGLPGGIGRSGSGSSGSDPRSRQPGGPGGSGGFGSSSRPGGLPGSRPGSSSRPGGGLPGSSGGRPGGGLPGTSPRDRQPGGPGSSSRPGGLPGSRPGSSSRPGGGLPGGSSRPGGGLPGSDPRDRQPGGPGGPGGFGSSSRPGGLPGSRPGSSSRPGGGLPGGSSRPGGGLPGSDPRDRGPGSPGGPGSSSRPGGLPGSRPGSSSQPGGGLPGGGSRPGGGLPGTSPRDRQPGGPGVPGSSSRPGGLPGSRPGSSSRPGGGFPGGAGRSGGGLPGTSPRDRQTGSPGGPGASSRPGAPGRPGSTSRSASPGGLPASRPGSRPGSPPKAPPRPGSSAGASPSRGRSAGRSPASPGATVKPRSKTRTAPRKADDELLSLDTRLDIIGIVLIIFALITLLSFLSGEPGALTRVWLRGLYQLFGWGAWVIPIPIGAIGVWLIWRHFGDQLPPVDPVRIVGVGIVFFGSLTLIHALLVSFDPVGQVWINPVADPTQPAYLACPAKPQELINAGWVVQNTVWGSKDLAQCGTGGGFIGHAIQSFLRNLIGAAAVFIITIVAISGGGLMATRKTLKDVLEISARAWEWMKVNFSLRRPAVEEDEEEDAEEEAEESKAPAPSGTPGDKKDDQTLTGRPSIVTGLGPGGSPAKPPTKTSPAKPTPAPAPAAVQEKPATPSPAAPSPASPGGPAAVPASAPSASPARPSGPPELPGMASRPGAPGGAPSGERPTGAPQPGSPPGISPRPAGQLPGAGPRPGIAGDAPSGERPAGAPQPGGPPGISPRPAGQLPGAGPRPGTPGGAPLGERPAGTPQPGGPPGMSPRPAGQLPGAGPRPGIPGDAPSGERPAGTPQPGGPPGMSPRPAGQLPGAGPRPGIPGGAPSGERPAGTPQPGGPPGISPRPAGQLPGALPRPGMPSVPTDSRPPGQEKPAGSAGGMPSRSGGQLPGSAPAGSPRSSERAEDDSGDDDKTPEGSGGASSQSRPGSPTASAGQISRPGTTTSSSAPGTGSVLSRPQLGAPSPGIPDRPGAGRTFGPTPPASLGGQSRPVPKPLTASPASDDDEDEDDDIFFDDLEHDDDGPSPGAGLKSTLLVDEDEDVEEDLDDEESENEDEDDDAPPVARPSVTAPSVLPRPSGLPSGGARPASAPASPPISVPQRPQPPAAPSPVKQDDQPTAKVPAKPPAAGSPTRRRKKKPSWKLPSIDDHLDPSEQAVMSDEELRRRAAVIEQTLSSFGAPGRVVEVNHGPVITQFGVEPDYIDGRQGKRIKVKVGKISALADDLALALAAPTIRIEAPVPGKGFVGIEVPNAEPSVVTLHDVMNTQDFKKKKTPLRLALGQDVSGQPVIADLTAMPHMLIAGTTGSGKSVCVNGIICTMLMNCTPEDLRMIMVDPKRVELTNYNGIPHLMAPVVTELERIVGVLKWVQREMDDRYRKFAMAGARNITDYNSRVEQSKIDGERLPYLILVVDELADLMMLAPDETERVITRLAQMARATGIHIILSTQRPSVDVVTGLIKANFPARIAFAVATGVDSRVILDMPGAEKLLGRGDMLFQAPDAPLPTRMQGVYLSDDEIQRITDFWRDQAVDMPAPTANPFEPSKPSSERRTTVASDELPNQRTLFPGSDEDDEDALFNEAVELVRDMEKASISLLQRHLRIGYTRAARLIDLMEERGVIGPHEGGSKPREVLADEDDEDDGED